MPRPKRIRTPQSQVHNEDIEPTARPNEMEASQTADESDLIRAEGEGMVTTDQPNAEVPPLPLLELFKAQLDAAGRSLTQVQIPAMKRAIISQVQAHPIATIGVVAVAGALGALLIRPSARH